MYNVNLSDQVIDKISDIEHVIQEEVGRNLSSIFLQTEGNLISAVCSLLDSKKPKIGIISGFYISSSMPPAAETDGPLGAALLLEAFEKIGIGCRFSTDKFCATGCQAALKAVGVTAPIDIIDSQQYVSEVTDLWASDEVTHVISIERVGKSIDGVPRNMRGLDIGENTILMDDLFLGGPWHKIAIGDGGNELGMGSIPRNLIIDNIDNGENIACVTPADILISSGVSNWGAYGLLGAMAVANDSWRLPILSVLNAEHDRFVLEYMVENGPCVDGLLQKPGCTVDGMPIDRHHGKINLIREIISKI